uniref:Carbohydrate kinase PfkB domain-containing protein n=1 Tax=Setaria digitata TaxID=48799 RepID=A0A915PPY2_9BILA
MDKRIIVVGLSCIDIVNYVESYPAEDSNSRVIKQIWTAGGNATNNITVLNQLNSHSVLFSVVPIDCSVITSLLLKVGISLEYCIRRLNGELPISTVIVNEKTGSRTIMHYRGQLKEPNCEEFQRTFSNICSFSWIHFEGRNFENLIPMIEYVRNARRNNKRPKISLECEKTQDFETLENAILLVDVVFVSKDFARKKGFKNKEEAVSGIQQRYGASHAIVICPWAEQGAAARHTADGEMISVDAYVEAGPAVDTLGAGDCFLACCIHFLNEGDSLKEVLMKACRITGRKVAKRGLLRLDIS